jgi:hypothetical protein
MGVSYAVDIANIALQRLGQPTISTLTEASRDANICNELYNQNRDYCFMLYDWDCLTQRQVLARAGKVAISAATQADPVEITCETHTFVSNELIYVESVAGMTELNNNTYRVYAYTSVTISLYDLDGSSTDGSGYTAWTSGGYVYKDPSANWGYVYDLPSDCLKVLSVLDSYGGEDESYEWKKERSFLYTDVENAGVKYLKQETDCAKYESDLVEVIASRLAWYISMRINSDTSVRNFMYQEMNAAIGRAAVTNAQGKSNPEPSEELWIHAR